MSGLLIGGLAFAAAALIGVVGIGGYVATRALNDKPEPVALGAAPSEAAATSPATPSSPDLPSAAVTAPAPVSAPVSQSSQAAQGPEIDVSSLPSAPGRSSGARGVAASAPAERAPLAAPAQAAVPAPRGGSGGALPPPLAAAPTGGARAATPAGGATLLPPPPSAPAAAAAAPAAASSTGVIRVDPKLRAVVVDGSYHRANDGAVVVSCGPHRVKAGMGDVQSVNVPCGGAVSL